MEESARYYDGKVAQGLDVRLTLTGQGLLLESPAHEVIDTWPYAEIAPFRIDDTGGARLVRAGGAGEIRCGDPVLLRVLDRQCRAAAARSHKRPEWLGVAGWIAGAVGAVVLFFVVGLPLLAAQVALLIPPAFEERLGAQVAAQLAGFAPRKDGGRCDAADGRAALARVVERLSARQAHRLPFTLHVVDAKVVNAFALPGGHIVIFRGLLDFMEHPNELAGVLAHEMGHSDLRHPTEVAIKRGAGAFAIGLLLGDVTGVSTTIVLAQVLASAAYTREAEAEADDRAFASLAAAGLTAAPFAAFFQRLEKKEGGASGLFALLETHPASVDRAARAGAADRRGGGEVLNPAEWLALKKVCG